MDDPITTAVREHVTLTDQGWAEYENEGFTRLGLVYPEEKIDRLCERIDEIMLGGVQYEGILMQLCPSAKGGDETGMNKERQEDTLKYRKIQDLERDPLFLEYMKHPLFTMVRSVLSR